MIIDFFGKKKKEQEKERKEERKEGKIGDSFTAGLEEEESME